MRGLGTVAASIIALPLMANGASAGETCVAESFRIPSTVIETFRTAPSSLLSRFPTGGAALTRQVRNLVATDADLASAVLALLTSATENQKSALGAGLSQAAQLCVRGNHSETARSIQESVARVQDNVVFTAFVSAANAVETSALGVRSSSLFSGVGAVVNNGDSQGSGNFGDAGGDDSFVLNTTGSFSASGAGGSIVNLTRNASPTQ